MIDVLRRYPIRLRLIALGVVPLLLAAVVAAVAVLGFIGSVDAAASASASSDKAQLALGMKYQAADWNGWQTAYAFDAGRGVKDAADDTGESRAAYLTSQAALLDQLSALESRSDLTADEQALLAEARTSVDAFIAASDSTSLHESPAPAGAGLSSCRGPSSAELAVRPDHVGLVDHGGREAVGEPVLVAQPVDLLLEAGERRPVLERAHPILDVTAGCGGEALDELLVGLLGVADHGASPSPQGFVWASP
jgi:hypothetical protein